MKETALLAWIDCQIEGITQRLNDLAKTAGLMPLSWTDEVVDHRLRWDLIVLKELREIVYNLYREREGHKEIHK